MEGMSERAYAAHSGLARGPVQKARKNGRLVLFADKSIIPIVTDANGQYAHGQFETKCTAAQKGNP
jgi:hypothetical protein